MFGLSKDALNFGELSLTSKKLVYSCDIKIKKNMGGLHATGSLRFGPFSGNVELQTRLDDDLGFEGFEIHAPAVKFWQKYQCVEGRLYYTRSKDDQERAIDQMDFNWWDPLSLLVQVRFDLMHGKLLETYHTFSKNKFTALDVERGTNYCRLIKKGMPLVSISQKSDLEHIVKIDKLGAELTLRQE